MAKKVKTETFYVRCKCLQCSGEWDEDMMEDMMGASFWIKCPFCGTVMRCTVESKDRVIMERVEYEDES